MNFEVRLLQESLGKLEGTDFGAGIQNSAIAEFLQDIAKVERKICVFLNGSTNPVHAQLVKNLLQKQVSDLKGILVVFRN